MKIELNKTLKLFSLLWIFGLSSCESPKADVDIEYVKSAFWQWHDGFKIGDGDFVDFDTTHFHSISHDTIFRNGVPRCVIVETDKANYLMKVESFNGEVGYYDDSEQFTK